MITHYRIFEPDGDVIYVAHGVTSTSNVAVTCTERPFRYEPDVGSQMILRMHMRLDDAMLVSLVEDDNIYDCCSYIGGDDCYMMWVNPFNFTALDYVDWNDPASMYEGMDKLLAWARGLLRGEEF